MNYYKREKKGKLQQVCIINIIDDEQYEIEYDKTIENCDFTHIQNMKEIEIEEFRDIIKKHNLGVYCSKSVLGCSISK